MGTYNGGQHEVAAGLELKPDGRFSYGLAYGALDQEAEGRWELEGTRVLLTSDPVVAPKFVFLGQTSAKPGELSLDLDLPKQFSRQYFDAVVTFADGEVVERQFAEDGLKLELPPGGGATSVTLKLDVFGLHSENFTLSSGNGTAVRFRFEPNDLGKVAFARTPLLIDGDTLLLEILELRLRFRPQTGGCTRRR